MTRSRSLLLTVLVLTCVVAPLGIAQQRALTAEQLVARAAQAEQAGRIDEAIRDYDAARARDESSGNSRRLASTLISLGYAQYLRGDTNASLVNLQRAYNLAVKIGEGPLQRDALSNIAHVYAEARVGQYDRAIEYYKQLLPQFEQAGERVMVADTLYNLGSTYERKDDFAHAEEWFRRALAAEETLGRQDEVAYVKRSIGVILGKQGRTEEALAMLEEALRFYVQRKDDHQATLVRQSRGVVYRRDRRFPEAIADLESTRLPFKETGNLRFLEKTEEELALAYSGAGRFREAYAARTRQLAAQAELATKLREENTARLRVQFDAERKEQENRALLRDRAAALRIARLQTVILVLGAAIILTLAYLIFRLIHDRRRIRVIALTDDLTGLPNRRQVLAEAAKAMEEARVSRQPLSLLTFDLDHFKRVNDEWGHASGDQVLQRVARRARMTLDPAHTLGRTGGEEFLAILPATSASAAASAAESLRAAIESLDCHDIANELRLTISIGIAQWANDESLERLMARADAALYEAKTSGRNRVAHAR